MSHSLLTKRSWNESPDAMKQKVLFICVHNSARSQMAEAFLNKSSAERCPIFPGVTRRLHWSFPDPAALTGTREERLAGTRKIRDQIRARIEMWCDEMCAVEPAR